MSIKVSVIMVCSELSLLHAVAKPSVSSMMFSRFFTGFCHPLTKIIILKGKLIVINESLCFFSSLSATISEIKKTKQNTFLTVLQLAFILYCLFPPVVFLLCSCWNQSTNTEDIHTYIHIYILVFLHQVSEDYCRILKGSLLFQC